MFYLDFDTDGYLSSIYTSDYPQPGVLSIESLSEYDFSNSPIRAYHWDGEKLILDPARVEELQIEQQQEEEQHKKIIRKDTARSEITDAVLTATINTVPVDDATALRWIDFYPEWSGNTPYSVGFKTTYQDRLWRCIQAHTSQVGWEPTNVPALWEEICESHSGTIDDPIPYNNNMTLENGKYYSQFSITYHCIRDTGVPVYNNLADLVSIYVEIA